MADEMKKISSSCHQKVKKYISELTYITVKEDLEDFYNGNAELWEAYANAVDSYAETSDEIKAEGASVIYEAAIALRNTNKFLKNSILLKHKTDSILIKDLKGDSAVNLLSLKMLMTKKMSGGKTSDGSAVESMHNSFCEDIDIFNNTGMFNPKWYEKQRIAKLKKWCFDNDKKFPIILDCSNANKNLVSAEKTRIEKASAEVIANSENQSTLHSNKFMVDYIICVFSVFKKEDVSYLDMMTFLRGLSIISKGNGIGKEKIARYISLNRDDNIKKALVNMSEGNSIFMNPGKITISRLFGCACLFNPTYTIHGILQNKIKTSTFELLSEIYVLEKERLSDLKGSSSDCEYLFNQILTLGTGGGFQYNKNKIEKNALSVKFDIN